MEAGSLSVARHETDVARLITEVCEKIQPQMTQKQIDFDTVMPSKLPKLNLDKDKIACKVDKFIEKPDLATAQDFCKAGGYLWNCGIFLWKISAILEELMRHAPEIYSGVCSALPCLSQNKGKYNWRSMDQKGREIFISLPSASIDYAVMEKSQNVAAVPVTMEWNDVGSWNALASSLLTYGVKATNTCSKYPSLSRSGTCPSSARRPTALPRRRALLGFSTVAAGSRCSGCAAVVRTTPS